MENITFDGNSGDVNWEDFININGGGGFDEDYEEEPEVIKAEEEVDFATEDL